MPKLSSSARRAAKLAAAASTETANVPTVIETETTVAETVTGTDIATVHADDATVIDNATSETVTPPETAPEATEAKPDQHAARKAVIAADRAAVAALYAGFNSAAVSVPVKPVSGFKPVSATPHANARRPTVRQSAAIATMLAASGNKLADGSTFPRIAEIDGLNVAIENGCAADMLRAGLVSVSGDNPADEIFTILPKQAAIVISHISGKLARAAGILA